MPRTARTRCRPARPVRPDRHRRRPARTGALADTGVGIIEIIVAMTLFGLLSAAVAPVLLASVRQTARAAQLATASQIANQQVERARSAATSCEQLRAHLTAAATAAQSEVHDSRGIVFQVTETPVSQVGCPDADGLVDLDVTVRAVTPGATNPVRATVQTDIWVGLD